MSTRGKSINVYLMDGEPNGRIKCSLSNWTGVAYKIPRTELERCKDREDLKQSGVYFLFGISDLTGNNVAYIGQAGARKNEDGLLCRLQEHKRNPEKDYWTEAVVFTTSNNSFGPTEISYLENKFCRLAIDAKRYDVKNKNDPNQGNITEEKESELEEFVDYARIVMGTLGHRVFESLSPARCAITGADLAEEKFDEFEEPILHFKRASIKAAGRRTSEGFVVFKGSALAPNLQKSCPENVIMLREKHKEKIDKNNLLTEDVLFASPSAAAAFVGGSSLSGNEFWATEEGVTLKNLEKSE